MFVYLALNRLFPNSFTAKVFFIAFLGTHVPLIAATAYLFWKNGGIQQNIDLAVLLLLATLVGTAVTLASLHAILRPVYKVGAAMRGFETERKRALLPDNLNDELGLLMQLTNRLVLGVDAELRETREAATKDPLTGALNRRGFIQALRGPAFQPGMLLYVDLDHFKRINDLHGHDMGDKVLLGTADTMRDALRAQDLLGRFGGEEFVIFLPNLSQDEGRKVAERVRKALSSAIRVDGQGVTASVGVTRLTDPSHFHAELARADEALYRAKAQGRDRVELAHGTPPMRPQAA